MHRALIAAMTVALLSSFGIAQDRRPPTEQIDTTAITKIIDEGMNRSKVMDILSSLTDVVGPRLTWSPGYAKATAWTSSTFKEWGLQNVAIEGWEPLGRGWTLKRYSATVIADQPFPLLSYPKAWSPGTKGTVTAEVVHFDAKNDSSLETFRGKLKGKFLLMNDPVDIEAHWEPQATRAADSTLLQMANADVERRRGGRRPQPQDGRMQRAIVEFRKQQIALEEKAAGILTVSRGDGGTIFVQSASIPQHPDSPFTSAPRVSLAKGTEMLPQIVVAAEHYNRLVRMIQKGEKPALEVALSVSLTEPDSGYNVIAEIPGTDLKDEVVMIGGHLDSWHGGTGTTDDGTGVATCMEAMRILKTLDLKPRRTIRIGLWGGEEEGLLGSRAYVKAHLGQRQDTTGGRNPRGPQGPVVYTPEGERFCAYFNNDNGTGKVRGIYLQGNEALRPIFRAWLAPFRKMGASTITALPTGGTDHQSFDGIGLPGFQWIQDDVEYFTRTWHSTMDVYDRAQPDDLKQASVLMAAFAYNAAMRDAPLPRTQR